MEQKSKYLPSDVAIYTRIVVRRRHLFEDALHRFHMGINFNKHLHVTFVGEQAVDAGGPLREFFSLVMKEIALNNSLFAGDDTSRVPVPNITALEKETYQYIGQMIAASIIHGGPAPTFFAPSVVEYILCGLKGAQPDINEVPDYRIRHKLEVVSFYN